MKILKSIILYLNIIRFFPHLIIYSFSKNKSLIVEDIEAYQKEYSINKSKVFSLLFLLFHHRSFRGLFYFRIGEIKWLIRFLAPEIQNLGFSKTPIGGGLILYHAYGTILNATSIGRNCKIAHNVTLGYKNGIAPTLKDNVEVFTGATIVGGITIGNNCVIGPGAVVFKDIPDNCVVVGNPAYILKEDGIVINKKL